MVNDIELKNLDGITYAYVCECGHMYWPWITIGPNMGTQRVECPCNGESGRKVWLGRKKNRKRLKYRKTPKEQTMMDGRNLRKAFWGEEWGKK